MTGPDNPTRDRLLTAAAEIFAAHGFAGASVREICDQAGANVAAINYHFGSKEGLFAEVLRLPLQQLADSIPAFTASDIPLRVALERMYDGMLAPLRVDSPAAAAMRLIVRTMATGGDHPRPDPEVIQRHHAALAALVRRHLPPAADDGVVNVLCGALVGMAMHAVMGRFRAGPVPPMLGQTDAAGVAALAARLAVYGAAIVATEAGP